MKHEFKVTKSKEQTVYTLESATGGSTSSGDFATVDTALGVTQRRNPPGDNILAQEKKEPPKTRNFVAKNAKMGGAGQHKDKKKAAKQGDVKHKKPLAEDHEIQMAGSELQSIAKNAVRLLDLIKHYSEQEGLDAWQQSKITKAADYLNSVLQSISGEQSGMEETRNNYHANTTGFSRGNRDDERHDLDTQADPRETMMYNLTINGKPLNPEPIMGRSNLIKFGKQQQAAGVDLSNALISPVDKGVEESGLQYSIGVKKHGKEYMTKSAQLARNGASQEELGALKDRLSKAHKGKDNNEGVDTYLKSLTNMLERSVSQAQHNLMVGVAHNPQFAQKVKVKQKVGQEFAQADVGHDISKLPIRVPKKK